MRYDAVIAGGGASGLFCASVLSEAGLSAAVVEPNRFLGRKLRITGKGRCNLTNNCAPAEVMKNVIRNPKFLYSALSKCPPERIMEWFEGHGVPLKTERGRRVFPMSDRADDVADAMARVCEKNGVEIIRAKVDGVIVSDGTARGLVCGNKTVETESVILACGGMSYPRTGSDGSGYRIAERLGHSIVPPRQSLVPVTVEEDFCRKMSGLTLKNVTLSLYDASKPSKPIYREFGELTFFDFGIGGPLGISSSCFMDAEKLACKGYKLVIDFKPALDREQLDARLLRDIKSSAGETVEKLLLGLLPKDAAGVVAERINLDISSFAGNMTREQRLDIINMLKGFELTPTGFRPFDEAIVTSGGVSVKEIYPSSMESRLVKDLYFTGEIIDVDGFTGGYNLTIAFSTAFCAADDIIKKKEVEKWD